MFKNPFKGICEPLCNLLHLISTSQYFYKELNQLKNVARLTHLFEVTAKLLYNTN